MAIFIQAKKKRDDAPPRAKRISIIKLLPSGKELLVAGIPIALAAYYLTRVAPALVPLPEGIELPFPAATRVLERTIAWCGKNPERVLAIAGGFLGAGALLRFRFQRYYLMLGLITALSLAFTYYSISAPVDRLLKNVKDNIPQREVPDYLPKGKKK